MHQVMPTSHYAVLEAFRRRAIDRLTWATDKTCFLSDFPIPEDSFKAAPATLYLSVCAGAGVYDEPAFIGGGYSTLHELGRVSLTALYLNRRDTKGKAKELLTNPADGFLTKLKPDLLRLGKNDDESDWMPMDEAGEYALLTRVPMPVSASMPQRSVGAPGGPVWAFMQIDFVASWRWDL